jgi:hypothetical protein
MGIPESLRRPVRLPNLGRDGACPATPAVGPQMTRAHPVAQPGPCARPGVGPSGRPQGRWWRPTRLRVGAGCYGLQIGGPGFSEVLVIELK